MQPDDLHQPISSVLSRRQCLLLGASSLALGLLGACGRRQPRGLSYRVETGDSLATISRRSGVAIADIVTANRLRNRTLQPGQILLLPGIDRLPPPAIPAPAVPEDRLSTNFQVVRRREWGAQSLRPGYDPMGRITRITLHHSAEIPGLAYDSDPQMVHTIQRIHQDRHRWSDIGYHWIIGTDGRLYEGRAVDLQGAHSGGDRNIQNLGIVLIGDFMQRLPNPRQLATTHAFLREQQSRYRVGMEQMYGHRDLGVTLCPGDKLYAWLQDYRRGHI